MNGVNKTLYIPLYGKAYMSRRKLLLEDTKAEEIWAAEKFPLKGKSKSKWLAYNMAMRSVVFDRWLKDTMDQMPGAVVLHVGCDMDSRICRVGAGNHLWYDVDFPEVIRERNRYFEETHRYHMIASDVRALSWLEEVPGETAIVVMEGISMYLKPEELLSVLAGLKSRFKRIRILMDCYTELAAKLSRRGNPINQVGVTQVYGSDDPVALEKSGLHFLQEHDMTPEDLITQLAGMERFLFRKLYAGKLSKNLYRMYEYR